jgi:DNA-binding transcriptional ArsR family regulator
VARRWTAEDRRRRLGRRHRLATGARADDPVAAADAVVALHGTDATSVVVAAWARMARPDLASVERALVEERRLVRVLAMRRTLFVAPVATASVLLAAASRDVAARERRKLLALVAAAGHEDPEAVLAAAGAAMLEVLGRLGEATAQELAAADERLAARVVVGAGTRTEVSQSLASRLLTVLGAEGAVVRTRPRGTWTSAQFRWAPMAAWQPEVRADLPAATAQAELAGRYLRAFGPVTEADLRWWTGWGAGVARRALGALDLVEVDLADGGRGLLPAGDAEREPDPGPWVALLPALDPTTMGWRGRGWYLGDHGPSLFDVNGNAGPTAWVDGRVVGGWASGPGGEVRLALLEDVGSAARAALEAAAGDLEARLDGVVLGPRARGRSPVERELLA